MTTFDFSPGAQVPLTDVARATAATQALSSAAYRDEPMDVLIAVNEAAGKTKPRVALFEPNLGEAFCRAVQTRMLGGGRGGVVQSFGTDPAAVVQHCLAAAKIRKDRDTRLTGIVALFGVLFLPGTLVWLGAFQLRRMLKGSGNPRNSMLAGLLLFAVAGFAFLFFLRPPFSGVAQLYFRVMLLVPVVGWMLAKRVCLRTTERLRREWTAVLEGSSPGPTVPEAVPRGPGDSKAESMRIELEKLVSEQNSNVVFYAGRKGILGMGPRWGSWAMAEELSPRPGADEIHPFRCWDVIRAIHGRLRELERGPLHTGGFPTPSIKHWIVVPIGEGADAVSRPSGPEMDGYSVKDFEIQRVCNEQQFGSGNRHYLGVQFVLWEGQLVLTLLVTVTVLHHTLRVEVTGHTLGPVAGALSGKPAAKTKDVPKSIRFYETKSVKLPLVDTDEVTRLTARAPFTWTPTLLDWLGGKLTMPEPFGLRHTWAGKPWGNRFMADDILRAATPVLRAVHSATMRVLEENAVDTEKFSARSLALGGAAQAHVPSRADNYDA